jgi:hypothetical protein
MKRILSERNLAGILFIAALIVFSFAQEDAKKIEKMNQSADVSSLVPAPQKTAQDFTPAKKDDSPAKELK